MFTWIPRDNLAEMVPQLHLQDLQSGILAVDSIIHRPNETNSKLVELWALNGRELARYGLNLIKEIETRAHTPSAMNQLGEVLASLMTGAAEFQKPAWWTEELCANHRAVLKYLDIRRTLRQRVKKHIGDPDGWFKYNKFGSLVSLTAEEVARANEILDVERAPERRPFYTHWKEEPTSELIWP